MNAKTADVDRQRATVSHPFGLEASPTGRAPKAYSSAVGFAAAGPGNDGHDLGGRRFSTRKVRDGTRVYPTVPTSTISEILAGKKHLNRHLIRKLADYFQVEASVLAANDRLDHNILNCLLAIFSRSGKDKRRLKVYWDRRVLPR